MNNVMKNLLERVRRYREKRYKLRFRNKIDEALDVTFDEYGETFDNLAKYDKGMI